MRFLVLLLAALTLAGCTSTPLPAHSPEKAWVDLYSIAGTLLMADRVDGERWPDGRYFQVTPGQHELQARFMFEVRGVGADGFSEPNQTTCLIRFRYADFKAGQRYRLEARPLMMQAQAWLYDDQRNVLARGKVDRCGPY